MTKSSRKKAESLARDIEAYTCGEVPSPLELLQAPTLEHWSTAVRMRGKEFVMVLTGDVYKHPDFRDGDPICTSALAWFDRKKRFARTENTLYALGKPARCEKESKA
jgi:hypothetical protein